MLEIDLLFKEVPNSSVSNMITQVVAQDDLPLFASLLLTFNKIAAGIHPTGKTSYHMYIHGTITYSCDNVIATQVQ